MPYPLLADAVLLLHFGVVLFVVGGLVVVVAGNLLRWRWVNGWWFRLAHLAAIAVIAVQAWLGQYCPLTTLESWLRVQSGASAYEESFIEHWVQRLMYYEAPLWLFALIYTVFAGLVVLAWWRFPPRRDLVARLAHRVE
jgi:polyferredoxin